MASSEVMCVEPHCATTGSGFYIIPGTGCRAYYHCDQGIRTDYLCPLATTYDRNKQVRDTTFSDQRMNFEIHTVSSIYIMLCQCYMGPGRVQIFGNDSNKLKLHSWIN